MKGKDLIKMKEVLKTTSSVPLTADVAIPNGLPQISLYGRMRLTNTVTTTPNGVVKVKL